MSRKGNGGDNAPTESGFNRFKIERVHNVASRIGARVADCLGLVYDAASLARRWPGSRI
jgi:hypothetical protein